MNMQRLFVLAVLSPSLILLNGCGGGSDGSGKNQDAHAEGDGHGHEDGGHDEGGDEHGEEVVKLSDAQLTRAGVVVAPLGGGEIATHVTLPAEVGLNLDTVLHVTPRVPGIVSSVNGYLGHDVQEGEMLAILESPELGEAKITFLQAIQEKMIADAELARQKTISENTARLLDVLREDPTPDELREQVADLRIGVNKGRLLSSYAQMKAGAANYAREKELNAKGLSTQADLLASQEMFNSAQAEYMGAFEDVDFSFRLMLQEAEQSAMIAASGVDNAERRLHLLGLTQDQVENIVNEPDVNVARYELRAPMNGQIVAKHITPGESVGTDAPVYTIADISTVWLNISVYTQYAGMIQMGHPVVVRVGDRVATGVVEYISPMVSEASRTVAARVMLDNSDGSWRPGEFVTVRVETDKAHADRVVPIEAIQSFEGHDVVFIQDEDGIEPVQVTIGRRNDVQAELLGNDVAIGTPVVVKNSFLIKAELGKSAAGHDH